MTRTSTTNPVSAVSTPVWRAIENASRRTGIDFDYLLDQARIESGFRADARAATSSAAGLYQFTAQTWLATLKRHGAAHGRSSVAAAIEPVGRGAYKVSDPALRQTILDLRTDPDLAALMAGELAVDNRARLADALGREPEPVDLYLAHFLGSGAASTFLKAWASEPDQAAAPLFPKAAAANHRIFYDAAGSARSLGEIRQSFAAKLESDGSVVSSNGGELRRNVTITAMPWRISFETHWIEPHRIEPMPKKLSVDFARDAYRKLAGLDGAGA